MPKNLFSRYIWVIDTIRRYGRITREELNELWVKSQFSNGEPLPRRTFYNYRNAIDELFKISIECDTTTFEYYIDDEDSHSQSVTDWLLNSATMSDVLNDARDVSSRIFLEDIPSARVHLATVIKALKECKPLRFTYQPFTRINSTPGVVVHPYFLKIFRQRWYVTGYNPADDRIKTYALDRITDLNVLNEPFEYPADFDPESFTRDSFGIVFSMGEVKNVVIKCDPRQAKYLRALPLHHSQSEMIHDAYSMFHYRLRLTPDFVEEILSHGPRLTVVSPPELRAMVITELRDALANYDTTEPSPAPAAQTEE